MKSFKAIALLIIGVVLLVAVYSHAATLRFDPSTGQVDGYKVYYTDGENAWSQDIGNVTSADISLFNLDPGVEYTFHVTAYNAAGESPPSNTAAYTPPAYSISENPKSLTIIIPDGPVTISIGE